MEKANKFWGPSYYNEFKCKCGECRFPCCYGWNISMSKEEYYSLLTLDCSKEIHDKLDAHLLLLNYGENKRYVQITPNYLGGCPLLNEKGLCSLQCECGEKALLSICRQYPRTYHMSSRNECCISNSCEKTIELLMKDIDKLDFQNIDIEIEHLNEEFYEDDVLLGIRDYLIDSINDRNYSLKNRIEKVLGSLLQTEVNLNDKIVNKMLKRLVDLYQNSNSLYGYKLEVENECIDNKISKINSLLENADIYLEKILINHLFYLRSENKNLDDYKEELAIGFEAVYFFIIEVLNNNMKTKEDFVDIVSRCFRIIEHSSFYKNVRIIYKEEM